MRRYIGLDVHQTSTTFAVIGESGKRLATDVVETNGQALVERLKTIPGKRHLCLEEGTQSAWLYEILSPHAEEIVVMGVGESRGPKSDERDAYGLAEKLRTGAIERRVFKQSGEYKTLREIGGTGLMVPDDAAAPFVAAVDAATGDLRWHRVYPNATAARLVAADGRHAGAYDEAVLFGDVPPGGAFADIEGWQPISAAGSAYLVKIVEPR